MPRPKDQETASAADNQPSMADIMLMMQQQLQTQTEQARLDREAADQRLSSVLAHIGNPSQPQDRPSSDSSLAKPSRISLTTGDIPPLSSPTTTTLASMTAWQSKWEGYVSLNTLTTSLDGPQQIAALRLALHDDWLHLWDHGALSIEPCEDIAAIVAKLVAYQRDQRNPLLDRQEFHKRNQAPGESIHEYVAELRAIAARCAFPASDCVGCRQHLRDRVICGLRDPDAILAVLKLPFDDFLTLSTVLSTCKAIERSKITQQSLSPAAPPPSCQAALQSAYRKGQAPTHPAPHELCLNCGNPAHASRSRDCPAWTQTCTKCHRSGHLAQFCRSPHRPLPPKNPPPVAPSGPPSSSFACCLSGFSPSPPHRSVVNSTVTVDVTSHATHFCVDFIPDTGSDIDVVPPSYLSLLPPTAADPTSSPITLANGTSVSGCRTLPVTLSYNGQTHRTTLHVFPTAQHALLSRWSCVALGLLPDPWPTPGPSPPLQLHPHELVAAGVTNICAAAQHHLGSSPSPPPSAPVPPLSPPPIERSPTPSETMKQQLLSEFSDVFDDSPLRTMHGPPMTIQLTPDAIPFKRMRAYAVPYHWRDAVQSELTQMESGGIIEKVPVGEPLEWCHPMVVVAKKGSGEPRITVDLTKLNKFVRRPVHPTPVPHEIVARLTPGNAFFSTLDCRKGYWQVPLDDASKHLTSFITPWGTYRFCRNVMGLQSANDEYVRRGDDALEGVANIAKIVDDIIVSNPDPDSHLLSVREVLQRCRRHGITLNPSKFVFGLDTVEWCGYSVTHTGYSVAPHLVHALRNFPVPTNRTDVRSFLGLVQQFEAFSRDISTHASPFRDLLKASSTFVWTATHQLAFEALRTALTNPRILAHFHHGRPLRLETDAAQSRGLGFALSQQQPSGEWRLLQCGSRFLTDAESRYSATEAELLAIVWAVNKCRLFVLGHPFSVITDHRPLIPILNSKTLDEIDNPRLLRLKAKLSGHSLTAIWREGNHHLVADAFSRYPVDQPSPADNSADSDIEHHVCMVRLMASTDHASGDAVLPDTVLSSIAVAAAADPAYQQLLTLVTQGFPADIHEVDAALRDYWKVRDSLSADSGIVLKGARVVIPETHRRHVLDALHASHQGQDRTRRRARQVVYWPGLDRDIIQVVQRCDPCSVHAPSLPREPLRSHPRPSRPFEAATADLFQSGGRYYLVYADRYSGWPAITIMGRHASSQMVIAELKKFMTDTGIPVKLTSDGGPQFTSREFAAFVSKWGIDHDPSSPHNPQSNGHAESSVKAVKSLLLKASPSGNLDLDPFKLGLLELRNTPRADGRSPAQDLFGTPLRSLVPAHILSYSSEWQVPREAAEQRATTLLAKATKKYNQHSRIHHAFRPGDIVRIQDPVTKEWDRVGEVIGTRRRDRSYDIRLEGGRVLWRNRRFLKPCHVAPNSHTDTAGDDAGPQATTDSRRSHRVRGRPDYLVEGQ